MHMGMIFTMDSIEGEEKQKCLDVLRLELELEAEFVDVELEVITSDFTAHKSAL